MVYKKYVKKNGKIFGPYYCESYRDSEGKVKTRFISAITPPENYKKPAWKFTIKKPGWFSRETAKKTLIISSVILLSVFLIFGLFFAGSFAVKNISFTAFAISENISELDNQNFISNTEDLVQNFDTSSVDFSIKEPKTSGLFGEPITKNKNKRLDFQIGTGNLRLYFDLLNYSEFVETLAEASVNSVNVQEINIMPKEIIKETENNVSTIVNESASEIINNTPSEEINQSESQSEIEVPQINQTEPAAETPTTETPAETPTTTETSTEPAPVGITGRIIRFFRFTGRVIGFVGRVIGVREENSTITDINVTENSNEQINITNENQTSPATNENQTATNVKSNEISVDFNEVKDTLNNLSKTELQQAVDSAVISAENFDVLVNETKLTEETPKYKWGYRVKLNDLKFMAKIEITSDSDISKYDDSSLKIGKRNILSFNDLVNAGYKVRIETPVLEIPMENISVKPSVKNIIIGNRTTNEIINETGVETNVTIEENPTETNVSIPVNESASEIINNTQTEEINQSESQSKIKEPEINQTEPAAETPASNEAPADIPTTTPEQPSETPQDGTSNNKDKEKKEEKQTEKEQKKENKAEEKSNKKEEKQNEQAPAEIPDGVTGRIIRFFGLIGKAIAVTGKAILGFAGRAIGIEENMTIIEDVKYANIITVYIEKDFGAESATENINYEDLDNDGKISIGDIINLDPELIIIPISDAEELDSNRSYIRNVFNETSVKDENYVFINNSNFVRATFSKPLGKNNDITVFARLPGYFCNESIAENCETIIINETTNETQEVCENTTIENCPEISESENGKIEVYRENGNEIIASILGITKADYYKTYLDGNHGGIGLNESESYEVFDLKILNAGNVWINNSVVINGQEVSYDIFQKKKRIDEIRRLLNQS